MPPSFRVGLTGGIACGKSQVLARLGGAGFHTLDLDLVAHEVMAPGGAAYADVVATFGPGILGANAAIDRKALGAVVFRDEDARLRLNAIVHPRVFREEREFAARYAGEEGSVVVTDAALLVESGLHLRFDRLVVVHCPPEMQRRRLMARDGIAEDAARARIDAQMPIEEKRRFGHFEVSTAGSLEETRAAAEALADVIKPLASRPRPAAEFSRDQALGCLTHGPRRGPRGLCPSALVAEASARGYFQMERLKSLLSPAPRGAWYRAAGASEGEPPPVNLAGAVVVSCGRADEEMVLAAMASVARLTHESPAAIGNACVFALALLDGAVASPAAAGVPVGERLAAWRAQAARWAAGSFPDELAPVLSAAEAHPADVDEARGAAARAGGDPDLAGALVGLRAGSGVAVPSRMDEDAVDALFRISARPERD